MQKFITQGLFFSLTYLFSTGLLYGQEKGKNITYVAKAGNIFISEREFVQRFELLPGFGRQRRSQLETAKAEFLYTMIAEKLLAQEAIARNYDKDTIVVQSLIAIRKKLSRDELYRNEISQKVKISDIDIIRGMARAQSLPLVSYLYFAKEEEAVFIRQQMKKSKDFDALKIDSTFHVLRDTATVIWGDADPALEDAVYRLTSGEISPVIKAGSGFYIVKVNEIRRNTEFSSLQPNVLRDRTVDIIRLRKERQRFNEFMGEIFKDKIGYSLPRTFIHLAKCLREVFYERGKENDGLFSSQIMNEVEQRCKSFLNDSMTIVGNSAWTVGNVIDKLRNKYIQIDLKDSANIPNLLNDQMRELVQQELLEQESLRRGLDQQPAVREKMEMWREAILASFMKGIIRQKISASESEIYAFMKDSEHNVEVPMVQVRQLVTSTLDDMKKAMASIQKGVTFEDAIHRWSIDTLTRNQGGKTEYFPITMHPPVGDLAWRMNIGQVYGPVSVDNGYLLFEVLDKTKQPPLNDTAFASQFESAKNKLLNLKYKRTLNLFLAQTGEDRGFTIFEDRLKSISVTPIPMMTFRILGFGGKMFEVPFVDPQLDWLNVDPPKTKILP
ncbi:MAG: peptidylprolyl isomerase [Bacteroidota bacterium]|nr:peptidylprolyl isomerase [Bacteroidota bacterium]